MAYSRAQNDNRLHLYITSLTFQSPFTTVGIFLTPVCEAIGKSGIPFLQDT